MDGRMDGQMGWINEWLDGRLAELMPVRVNGCIYGLICVCMNVVITYNRISSFFIPSNDVISIIRDPSTKTVCLALQTNITFNLTTG